MGLFDTYRLAWGDAVEDVQTKQFEQSMSTWKIGARPPLSELDGDPISLENSAGLPPSNSAFCCVIEDTNLNHRWSSGLSSRYFALGHHQGIFADYVAGIDEKSAQARALALCKLWEGSEFGPGLRRRLSLLQERNSRAELSLVQTQAAILPAADAWEQELVRVKGKTPLQIEEMNKKDFFGGLRFHRLVDFENVSQIDVHQALNVLTSSWALNLLDFEMELAPSPSKESAQRIAMLVASKSRGWGHTPGPDLGADSIAVLDARHSALPARSASPERALALLAAGYWDRFEAEAVQLQDDPHFIKASRQAFEKICVSRLGGFWAAGVMVRLPKLALTSIAIGSESVPLIDWLVLSLGLPSRLVIPLIEQGAHRSPELIYAGLLSSHEALFSPLSALSGGLACIPPLPSGGLAFQAALTCSHHALLALAQQGLLSPHLDAACDAAREVFAAESRSAGPGGSFNLERMPAELRCATLMCEAGHRPEAPSTRLIAWLAYREQVLLDANTPTASSAASGAFKSRL